VPLINRKSSWTAIGFAGLLFLHYLLGLSATLNKCTTFDEIFHVVSGYSYNRFGDFRLHPENGMLPQRWLALPISFQRPEFPPQDAHSWKTGDMSMVGHLFFYKLGNDPDKLLFAGRAMNGLWSVGIGSLMFIWMRRIAGAGSAWFTLVLWAMCPTFLANGFLATSDIAASFFFLAATGSLWSVLHFLNWKRILICCVAMAGLFLSKFSAPIIIPIGLIMATIRLISREPWHVQWRGELIIQARWLRAVWMFSLAIVLIAFTWCMIWFGYGFRYSAFNPPPANESELALPWENLLAKPDRVSQTIKSFREHRLLPEAYLYGFLFTHHNSQARRAFLFGEFGLTGWFWFFPYCFFAKTPTGTLLLLGIAGITTIVKHFQVPSTDRIAVWLRAIYRTTPLWVLFCTYWCFAVSSHLNIGHRHILPTYGPMLMFAGIAAWWCQAREPIVTTKKKKKATPPTLATWYQRRRWPMGCIGTLGCILTTTVASLGMWPNYLAFFNMPSGWPKHAWKKLVDSSLDWGQDLPSLRKWIESEQRRNPSDRPIYLSYFGTGDPKHYGIEAIMLPGFYDYRPLAIPENLRPGIYCISATLVQGVYLDCPGPWTPEHERIFREQTEELESFKSAAKQQGLQALWSTITDEERQILSQLFRQWEQLRFTRLTHFLRRREPDAHVNYSILIFRVDEKELARSLNDPLDGNY
jgi:hypothetical protein